METSPVSVTQVLRDDQVHRLSHRSGCIVAEQLHGAFVPRRDDAVGIDDNHSVCVHWGIQPKIATWQQL